MFADRARGAAPRSTGCAASGTCRRAARSSMPAKVDGLIEVAELREVPRDELDVARAAAEGGTRFRRERRAACCRRRSSKAARRSTRRRRSCGATRSACRLMKRSALLLLAIAARSSSGTFRSSSRVSSTRMPRRASIAAFRRRATASVRSFSFVAARAASRRRRRRRGRDRSRSCESPTPAAHEAGGSSRRRLRRAPARGDGGAARQSPSARQHEIDDQPLVVSDGCVDARNAAKRGPRSTPSVDGVDRRGRPGRGSAAPAPDSGFVASSASASNLIVRRSPSCVSVLAARGVASIVSRAPLRRAARTAPSRAARAGRRR